MDRNPINRHMQQRAKRLHKARMKKIKSTINNKPPKRHRHMRRNRKREQLQEEQAAKIEREVVSVCE